MTGVGDRYGKLTVLAPAESNGSHKRWLCRCECGTEAVVWQLSLRSKHTTSCGCHKRNATKRRWEKFQKNGRGFWAKVDRSGGPDACWPWMGSCSGGYGKTSYKGKKIKAHRLAYLLTHGELDPEVTVRHTCDNKPCCNPKHLVPGTQLQNIQDMVDRGLLKKRQNGGHKNGRAKLNFELAEAIRRLAGISDLSQEKIAYVFGVSQNAISKIITGKRYAAPEE